MIIMAEYNMVTIDVRVENGKIYLDIDDGTDHGSLTELTANEADKMQFALVRAIESIKGEYDMA